LTSKVKFVIQRWKAKKVIESWKGEYDEGRPHRSLGERAPSEFAIQSDLTGSQAAENSP